MESEKTPNSQSNLEKENQSRRHHNPGLQAILQSCNHQDIMVLAQNRHSGQWNRIENPEMDPQTYGQLLFDKVGIKTVSSANGAGKTGHMQKNEPFLHHTQK